VCDDAPGYAFNGRNRAAVQEGWRGSIHSFAQDPVESVNFVETHDNRTWRDKIDEVVRAHLPDATAEDKLAIDRIGAFLVLLAQGVPFMHLGQDFYRTKRGNGNSYNAGDDVNKIRWEWKRESRALFDFYRGLAAIRNAHPAFRLPLRAAVEKRIHFGIIREPYFVCEIDAGRLDDQWRWIVAIVNPLPEEMHYEAPAAPAGWDVHVHDGKASVEPLFAPVPAGQILRIPPRSCALIARRR